MTRSLSVSSRVSTLALAIALVAGPTPAAAQSFQGTGTFTNPANGSISTPDGSTTNISITAPQAVIDWAPFDENPGPGAIGFQFDGSTATFSGAADFAVLNRVVPVDTSRAIVMDGIINSVVGGSPGGSVYFYSPGGIVIGSNAVIDVGSLVLTTSPITVTDDGNGNFSFIDGNGTVEFGQANANSAVNTVAGSQISALNEGSYIAMVAPRVDHGGTINVNGAAALVGAEAATLTFRTSGLFDIQVDMGTTDSNGVGVSGTITGPASAGPGDNHRAYLVAVPKNTALTMVIGGGANLGFDIAGAAEVIDNAVVLSAGYDIFSGDTSFGPSPASGADADISIANANFTSALYGRANGDMLAGVVDDTLTFASDASLRGRDLAKLEAGGGGNISVGGNLRMSADASGQNPGDSAQAGNITLQALAGGQISVTGDTVLTATGTGAFSSTPGTPSGDGRGGTILVQATSGGDIALGNVDTSGSLDADASGFGGSFNGNVDGGDGIGGTINIFASGDGTLTVAGATYLRVEGWGGQPSDCFPCGAIGGTGDAGTVNVQAHSGTLSHLDFRDVLFVYADGHGGDGQTGGLGLGGNVSMSATTGARVDVADDVSFAASGEGGDAAGGSGNGGNGIGGGAGTGEVAAFADGGTLAIQGDFGAIADGIGGQSATGTGGTGTGGEGRLGVNATGTVTVDGFAAISASGTGGNGVIGGNGIGGSATNGGGAYFNSGGGSLSINGLATPSALTASGTGGAGSGGAGGNATGGSAEAGAFGGTIHFAADLYLDGSAYGGDGDVGGNATALVSNVVDETDPIAAAIYATNDGTVDVDGLTLLAGEAVGGNGANGNGGNAAAGEIDVVAFFGDITLATLAVDVNATGGDGGNGGNGGSGKGGVADVTFGLGAAAVGGTINLGSATILADGQGGAGGDGADGATGGNGGTGGAGTGGRVAFAGTAGGGTLNSGAAIISAQGIGGAGGNGGTGSVGSGGNGGTGGLGDGDFIQTGTLSADSAPTSGGGANHTTLLIDTSATGGVGGDGGTGVGGTGTGGNGGAALGGESTFLVRGVLVTADSVQLVADATGGDGGAGSTHGNGGNATSGAIRVESKDRFGHSTERGSLIANSITGTAFTVGGDGGAANDGTTTVLGNSFFRVLNGDADVNLVSIEVTGDVFSNAQGPSRVSVRDGTALIDDFSFITTGQLTLDAGKQTLAGLIDGKMVSNSITLSAGTFVPDTDPAPAVRGSYQAGTFDISTDGDFVTNANLISGSDLVIDAPGSIVAANINAVGPADLFAGVNATTGNITSGDSISVVADTGGIVGGVMNAGDTILLDGATGVSTGALGNLTAAGDIQVLSGGSIVTGIATSNGGNILMDGDGSVSVGSVTAFGSATLLAGTNFNTGDINAGGPVTITALTGTMDIGNMAAGGDVNLTAGDTILGEDITTPGSIIASTGTGLLRLEILQSGGDVDLSAGGNLATGNVDAFGFVNMLAGDDIAFGDINAFVVDIDAGGSIDGGNIDSDTDITAVAGADIDLLDLLAGGITIEGFINGNVDLAAGGGINTGAIDAFGSVLADAGGAIDTGAIDALTFVELTAGADILTGPINAGGNIDIFTSGGDILTGNLTGTDIDLESETGDIEFGNVDADLFDFDAGGAVSGGNIVATSAATGSADGAVVLGNINVSGVPPVDEFSVGFSSATSIEVGDVFGADKVGFATFGNLVTGDLQAGNLIMTLVGGDITVGSMTTTGLNGEIYMADSQMFVDAGGLVDDFDPVIVLQSEPIPTGGSITINGPVDTTFMRVAAGGLLTLGGDVTVDSANLTSGDIQLAGGVTVSGSTNLYSINPDGTFIGDGLTGPGYMLSNAEYNAFQDVSMEVRPDLGAAALLFLGDLNIASGITEADFGIEDADDNDVGTIRVVGDVRMNNADGVLFFESETFQLDAATGSIVISADGTTPGGELIIAANNIHVAEGSILDQLAEDPQYDGYQDDLNAPASVQRPDGVIRAGTVSIEFGDTPADLYTLYVQNMGTAETPAGFVITDMNLGDDGEGGLSAGSVDLIINGQIVTGNGTLTGIDVRDLLVEGRDLTPFTDNSTINGCLLVGDCAIEPPPPPPPPTPLDRPDFQPSPGIQQEIVLAKENILPPPDFGNEDFIDDNDEETDEGETSAIAPPDPLFDTSELGEEAEGAAPEVGTSMRSNPGLTQSGDVDDPVSGSGNPALMETPAGPPSNEEKQQ